MNSRFLWILICFISGSLPAQILKPVKWVYTYKALGQGSAGKDGLGKVILTANIEKGWHIYAQGPDNGDGPIPTSFKFEKMAGYSLKGMVLPTTQPKVAYDGTFKKNIGIHEGKVVFEQKVILKKGTKMIKGSLEFMVCNDKQCLPPQDLDFEVKIP